MKKGQFIDIFYEGIQFHQRIILEINVMAETINLYTSNVLGAEPTLSFQYPLDARGPQLQMEAMQNLGMNYDPRYSLFLASEPEEVSPQKIKSQFTLRSLGASDGMTLYVALVDPITGKTIDSLAQPSEQPNMSSLPKVYSLNKQQIKDNNQPASNSRLPPISTPKPLIMQNELSARTKAPPSLLSIAKNNSQVNTSRNSNVRLAPLNNKTSTNLPPFNKNNVSSMLPPIAPAGKSNQPRFNKNRLSTPHTPAAPTSPRVNLPSFNSSNKNNEVESNNIDIIDNIKCSIDTNLYPVPSQLQPYQYSIDDYKTIKKIDLFIQIAQDKSTGRLFYLKMLQGTSQNDSFYNEFINVFDAENGAVLHLNGFIASPQTLIYDYSNISCTLEETLEAERISNAPKNWNNTTKTIVLFGIAEGMRQLHSKRIMHRNLKPSNIFLDSNYYPFIADAGFIREYSRNPLYTAPEILAGNEYKSKVDVFAFGMICYHVLATRPPFDSKLSYQDIKEKIINGERPNIPTTIPQPFANLIQSCWKPESSSRPSFSKIVEAFARKVLVLPGADLDSVLTFQRTIVPQYEAKELCKTAIFLKSANEGDARSMLEFGYCLMQGRGVIKNIPEAQKYLKMSAENDLDQGMFEYAIMLIKYGGDKEEAVTYIKRAAREGNREAQKYLTNPHNAQIIRCAPMSSFRKRRSNKNSNNNTIKSSDNENDPLDEYYKRGKELISKSPEESFENFKKSAENGNVKAQVRVAVSLMSGINGAKKDAAEANKYYQMAADQGNSKAQCNLAFNLQKGDGVKKDLKAANELYKKSADSGYNVAQFNYAYNLMNGIGIDKDIEEANKYYKLAADQGLSSAQYSYGVNLMKGHGVDKDLVEANRYFKLSAENGNAQAQCQLAMNYMNGIGCEKDIKEAFRYNKMAADQGNARAMCNCAFALQNGHGVEKDLVEANKYYKLSADKKYPIAQYNYGLNLENGTGIDCNVIEANKYYKLAADQGNSNAQLNYGINLFKGNGIKKNIVEANKYFKMSSEQNNNKAMYQYGINLLKGNGCEKDPELANSYLKKSADAGNVNAQFYYGYNLYNGNGVAKNPEEANKYYKLAADKGNSNCQCNLACSYLNGIGVEKDLEKANKYYKMSADQGNSVAQYNYGYHLLNGIGVEMDIEKGIEYLQMAAESNNASALYHLSICYETGNGVEKDLAKSLELLKKSESLGNKLAKRKLNNK